jgi:disulfide bond formation protein DsbB
MDARLQHSSLPETWAKFAQSQPIAAAAIVIAVGGAATVLGAWFFQFGLGLKPCPLCLEQRYPYYFAIPLAVLVLLGTSVGAQRKVLLAALFVITAGMLWNAGLGAYHAGVEWKLWEGPRDCSGPLDNLGSAGDLMRQLQSINITRCDEAAWRFLGLSLAGYNVLISLALAAVAGWGFTAGLRQPRDVADATWR